MAYKVTLTGTGSQTDFAIPYPYLNRTHIGVTVDGVVTAFSWVNDGIVRVSPAPSTGADVEIKRTTQKTPVVTLQDGKPIPASSYMKLATQSLYVAEETEAGEGTFAPLLQDNNLSDLDDVAVALANLGLPSADDLQWVPDIREHFVTGAEFGMVGDYVSSTNKGTDNTAAFNAACAAAVAGNKVLMIGKGNFRMASRGGYDNTGVGGDLVLRIRGAGSGQTNFIVDVTENTQGAILIKSIAPGKQYHVELAGFSVLSADSTRVAGTPRLMADDMLSLIRDPVPAQRVDNEALLHDLFVGAFGDQQAGSYRHYHFKGIRWLRANYLRALAAAKATDPDYRLNTSDAYRMTASLHLEDCWGFYIVHSEFNGGANTILVEANRAEGGLLRDVAATGGLVGLRRLGASNEPGFAWKGGHINFRDSGVIVENGRCTQFEDLNIYLNDGLLSGSPNPDSSNNPTVFTFNLGSGTENYINNNKFYFQGHKGISNARFIRSYASAGQVYHVHHNQVNNPAGSDTGKMGWFFDAPNKHRVFATGNSVAEYFSVPWRNGGVITGEQYRQSTGARANIFGRGVPTGAIVPQAALATYLDEASNGNFYDWNGTTWVARP